MFTVGYERGEKEKNNVHSFLLEFWLFGPYTGELLQAYYTKFGFLKC